MQFVAQIGQVYGSIARQRHEFARSVLFWVIAALVGNLLVLHFTPAKADVLNTPAESIIVFMGHVVSAYAVLAGWYSAHRYLIMGRLPESRLPMGLRNDGKAFEFVIAQVRNMLLLVLISLVFIAPSAAYFGYHSLDMTPEHARRIQEFLTFMALPLMLFFFSRLLLVAPMAARGQEEAVRRSWRATKGHALRINVLQIACLLPGIVLAAPLHWLRAQEAGGHLGVLAAVIAVLGTFYSLVLFVQLAENEYSKLIT